MTTEEQNRRAPEVRLTDETIDYLKQQIASAVESGLDRAMSPEAAQRFWETGFDVLGKKARDNAGGFLIGGIMTAAKKLFWIGLFAAAVYGTGGWAALKGFVALLLGKE